ncbi:MAG: WYL domain-containing protein [Corynebacterium sp.]|nr:WYL domain-containing protein [Corynebacterium sp.]
MAKRRTHEKLVMLMVLLPYAMCFGDRKLEEIAADFDIPRNQLDELIKTLTSVRFAMRHGEHYSASVSFEDELTGFDIAVEEDELAVFDTRELDVPLRLTLAEVTTVMANLASLETVYNSPLINQVKEKLEEYTQNTFGLVVSTIDEAKVTPNTEMVYEAMRTKRQISFTYNGDLRHVSVVRIFNRHGNTYITAWDEDKRDHRNFRLDRIDGGISILEAESTASRHAFAYDPHDPFRLKRAAERITVELKPENSWVLPEHDVIEQGEDLLRVEIPVADKQWAARYLMAYHDYVTLLDSESFLEEVRISVGDALSRYQKM